MSEIWDFSLITNKRAARFTDELAARGGIYTNPTASEESRSGRDYDASPLRVGLVCLDCLHVGGGDRRWKLA